MSYCILKNKQKHKIINYFNSRYGINKEFFNNYLLIKKNKIVSIISNFNLEEKYIKEINKNNELNIKNIGLEIIADLKKLIPSSLGVTIFSFKDIKFNYIEINRSKAISYFKKENFTLNDCINKNILSNGYILVVYNKKIIGSAYLENNKIKPNVVFINSKIK
jgi:hypothetical protein